MNIQSRPGGGLDEHPLDGMRILVTRPEGQAGVTSHLVRCLGAEPVELKPGVSIVVAGSALLLSEAQANGGAGGSDDDD